MHSNKMSLSNEQLNLLLDRGFIVIDDFLPYGFYQQLKAEAEQQNYRDARITDGLQQTIRSDGIAWIEKQDTHQPQGNAFLELLVQMGELLNRTFYAGIRRSEAHFARYSAGKFYAKHVDNPKGSDNRIFSCVFYMNTNWSAKDGGELIVYTKKQTHSILPIENRIIIFDSNTPHEVKPAKRTRLSIACWLRKDS